MEKPDTETQDAGLYLMEHGSLSTLRIELTERSAHVTGNVELFGKVHPFFATVSV